MSVTLQRHESRCLIKLEGQVTIALAAEVKAALVEWLAAETDLELDLEAAEEIDITVMQLLLAAAREAARTGTGVTGRVSNAAAVAARAAGFTELPGFPAA